MCGIAGYLSTNGAPADRGAVITMTSVLRHRGPDGDGYFDDGPVALGHRRLAILDLSPAGRQPMVTRGYAVTYNGEIYNWKELRRELEELGHEFRSQTDSEVVLHAFAAWGASCVNRFNGMFAFAIWDREKRELFLARDRYGIKPLYYMQTSTAFLFASETKALVASKLISAGVDMEALLEYVTFQNVFSDRTFFLGVKVLPAGTTLTVRADGRTEIVSHRYWDFNFEADPALTDEEEVANEVRRLLEQAVARQLVADVPVGSYLSGGIDSGAIVALASKQVPHVGSAHEHHIESAHKHLRTFTCGFDLSSASGLELAADERNAAELVSAAAGTEHYEVVLKAGDLERAMPELARAIETPRVGQSYPNYYVAGLAAKFNKVVLSGVGGDELFGGYPWRYGDPKFWQERLLPDFDNKRLFGPLWSRLDVSRRILPLPLPEELFRRDQDPINRALHFEAKTFLHGLLVVEDALAMAHGLEVRFPFLDNDLVDFAMRIPSHMKVRPMTPERPRVGKAILRKAVRSILPAATADAAKQGFSAPDGNWFRGQSLAYVWRKLLSDDSRIREYVDSAVLKELLEQHVAGAVNRRLLIWSLLSVEHFLRAYA